MVIETVQPNKSWFGLLVGSYSMSNADAIVMIANDQANSDAGDFYVDGYGAPTLDSS